MTPGLSSGSKYSGILTPRPASRPPEHAVEVKRWSLCRRSPVPVATRARTNRGGHGRAVARGPLNFFLIFVAILWIVPTFGLLLTSLMPATEITEQGWWNVVSQPSQATFDNYKALFDNNDLTTALWTTAQIAVGNTLLLVIVAALAGYAFAWLEFPGRDWLFVGVIALLVVPLQVALIPIFSLYNNTGLFDTVLGLVLFHVAFGLPFGDLPVAQLLHRDSRRTSSSRRASTARRRCGSSSS